MDPTSEIFELNLLPLELTIKILLNFSLQELSNLAKTSTKYQNIIYDSFFMREWIKKHELSQGEKELLNFKFPDLKLYKAILEAEDKYGEMDISNEVLTKYLDIIIRQDNVELFNFLIKNGQIVESTPPRDFHMIPWSVKKEYEENYIKRWKWAILEAYRKSLKNSSSNIFEYLVTKYPQHVIEHTDYYHMYENKNIPFIELVRRLTGINPDISDMMKFLDYLTFPFMSIDYVKYILKLIEELYPEYITSGKNKLLKAYTPERILYVGAYFKDLELIKLALHHEATTEIFYAFSPSSQVLINLYYYKLITKEEILNI